MADTHVSPPARAEWLRQAMQIEKNGWISLALWLRRRSVLAEDEKPFGYLGPLLAPMWVMTVLSALEVVALDVLIPWGPSWTWLRVVMIVIGIWGVVFVLGLLAGVTVHPHAIGPGGLRIRSGANLDVAVPWDRVRSVSHVQRTHDGRSVRVVEQSLRIAVGKQTTVQLTLDPPVEVVLPRYGRTEVTSIAFYADDSRGLAREIRTRIARPAG